jgi:hypothetical protein
MKEASPKPCKQSCPQERPQTYPTSFERFYRSIWQQRFGPFLPVDVNDINATNKATENNIRRLPKTILCCFVISQDLPHSFRISFLCVKVLLLFSPF